MLLVTTAQERGYHHGDLANALLDAVDEIVRERGALDVSLREAARRAGVSHSAPAHHFGDKDGMLAAFAQQGFDRLAAAMNATYREVADRPLREQVVAMGRCYLAFAIESPAHYEVMFQAKADHGDGTDLHLAAERSFLPLAVLVNQMGEAGVVEPDRGRYVATLMWSACHGVASMWIDGMLPHFYEDHTYAEVVEGVLDTLAGFMFDR